MAVTVNIYEGCGCGCGGSSTTGGAGASGGASGQGGGGAQTDGFQYTGVPDGKTAVNICDIATVVAPYVASLMSEFIQSVQQGVNAGEKIIDAVAELAGENGIVSAATVGASSAASNALDLFTDILSNQPDNLRAALESTEFQREFQFAAYQYMSRNKADNPMPLTRSDLLGWVNTLKLTTRAVWGAPQDDDFVIGFGVYLAGLANLINLNRINREATFAGGQGNEAICAYAAQQIGESYVGRGGTITPPLAGLSSGQFGDYTFYYVDDPGTFRLGQRVTIQSPGNLGNIVAIGWSQGDPEPTAGPNQQELYADGVLLHTFPDTGAGIQLIGDSSARTVIGANLDEFFPVRDQTIQHSVNFDWAGYNPTEYRVAMNSNANAAIYRVIYRFIVVVEA